MAARDLVFGVGDRVRASGRFVAGADGDWLDLARVHDLTWKAPGWKSDRSVRLIGADGEAVAVGIAANRGLNYVSVVGIWRDESIEIEVLSAEIPARQAPVVRRDPPCPPPPGGWRHDVVELDVDLRDRESSGPIVHVAIFRPSPEQEVLVVAATDVDAVVRQLSPKFPRQLCVVPSRFTRAQIGEVYDVLHANWRDWRLESFGTGSDEQAQPFVSAMMFRITAEMAEWADALPEGLVRLEPAVSRA